MVKRFFLVLMIGGVFFVSCDEERVLDSYRTMPNEWHQDSVASFEFEPPDTLNSYDLFINIRNNSDYRYSNLFLITKMSFPNGKVLSDTLQYEMTKPSGEWLGTGFGNIKENKLWYKEDFRFTESGNYLLTIQQAMRHRDSVEGVESLEGITEVGFRIERKTK